MPRIRIPCLPLLVLVLMGAACASAKTPEMTDLLRHRFVLVSVDGVPFTAAKKPDIEFGEGFRVSGQICNRYTSQGTLEKGVLTVKHLASTKMFCLDEELNQFEGRFTAMLLAGAQADLAGNTLTLRYDNHIFVYTSAKPL